MYEKLCYKSLTSKYEKPNSNFNISKILNLPFDILRYLLEYILTLCKIRQQLASAMKQPVVQTYAHGMTKYY